jgi:Amt family ammonium transporter
MTVVILKVLDAVMGLRVSQEDEMSGLDLSQHSETAYMLGGSASYGEYSMGGSAGAFEGMKPAEAKPRPSH